MNKRAFEKLEKQTPFLAKKLKKIVFLIQNKTRFSLVGLIIVVDFLKATVLDLVEVCERALLNL